jgi:hypothetical protein
MGKCKTQQTNRQIRNYSILTTEKIDWKKISSQEPVEL